MNTFLPYPNFRLSAHVIDARRLGKQRVECMQLLRMIAGHREGGAHKYHPATRMWREFPAALCLYTHCIITEWTQRGYVSNMLSPRTVEGCQQYDIPTEWATAIVEMPPWLGDEELHASHRATLRHKDPAWYAQFAWTETPQLGCIWPGRMPTAGEYLIDPEGVPRLVLHAPEGGEIVVQYGDATRTVSRAEIYRRIWVRGVESGM